VAKQIELGLEIAAMAQQEIADGMRPAEAFNGLIRQCIGRDADWKAFYVEQMDTIKPRGAHETLLQLYAAELEAEEMYATGGGTGAAKRLQALLDAGTTSPDDKRWYLQEMASYQYDADRKKSQPLQLGKKAQTICGRWTQRSTSSGIARSKWM
jgi:hypothetical protein